MSKAVLAMDMPENCLECPLRYEADQLLLGDFKYQKLFRCLFMPENIEDVYLEDIMDKKQDWCPLKPMPEKIHNDNGYDEYSDGYDAGWNSCIDAIGGGNSD